MGQEQKCTIPQTFIFEHKYLLINDVLGTFKNNVTFPSIGNPSEDDSTCEDYFQDDVLDVFKRLSYKLTGSETEFKLKSCNSTRQASFSSYHKTLSLSKKFAEKLKDQFPRKEDYLSVVGFIFAHELNHYVMEHFIKYSETGLTPSGNRDPSTNKFFQYQIMVYERGFKPGSDLAKKYVLARTEALRSHSEVDIAGLVLMKIAGVYFNENLIPLMNDAIYGSFDRNDLYLKDEVNCLGVLEAIHRQENLEYYSRLLF